MGYSPPHLNVRKITGGYSMFPNGATTDDLTIYPNEVDTLPSIKLNGAGALQINVNSGQVLEFLYEGPTSLMKIRYTANGPEIFPSAGDKDLCLSPSGTGRIRYGTHNASGDVVCNGYIEIKDSGGTTRKLMTTA